MIRKVAKILLPVFLVIAIATGGAYSLLDAKTEKITNVFEYSYSDEIELLEPSYEQKDDAFAPDEIIPKDPTVYNAGTSEAYVYISVFNPNNLFTYDIDASNWELITEHEETVTVNGVNHTGTTSYYSYILPLGAGESSTPLFVSVKFTPYDSDYENYLEDEEKAGNGSGSAIVGKTHPIIVNAYAVTTDIDDDMLTNSVTSLDTPAKNYGRMRAWEYLRAEMEEAGETHRCVSAVQSETQRVVEIYDLANVKLGEVTISSIGKETLNFDFVNNYLSKFGESYAETNGINIPLYTDEDEMYYLINYSEGSSLTNDTPVSAADNFRLNINMQYAIVYLTLIENGETLGTVPLLFENGTEISNETISNKVSEKYGVTITLDEEINETASYTDRYYLSIESSQITEVE